MAIPTALNSAIRIEGLIESELTRTNSKKQASTTMAENIADASGALGLKNVIWRSYPKDALPERREGIGCR